MNCCNKRMIFLKTMRNIIHFTLSSFFKDVNTQWKKIKLTCVKKHLFFWRIPASKILKFTSNLLLLKIYTKYFFKKMINASLRQKSSPIYVYFYLGIFSLFEYMYNFMFKITSKELNYPIFYKLTSVSYIKWNFPGNNANS
jgi:hypothetical protein